MAAVIIGSSLAGAQISIRSRTVLGGNCAGETAAAAAVAPAISTAPNAEIAVFIFCPLLPPSTGWGGAHDLPGKSGGVGSRNARHNASLRQPQVVPRHS